MTIERHVSLLALFFIVISARNLGIAQGLQQSGFERSRWSDTLMPQSRNCEKLLSTGEIQRDFFGHIAHATHSLNMEALEFMLNDSMLEAQPFLMPVVNPNLSSYEPILGSPVRLGFSDFNTFAMNQLDWVMTHRLEVRYDMGIYTSLERIMHQMHMIEVWDQVREAYARLHTNMLAGSPGPSADLCSCLNDVDGNGIVKLLRYIALQIREPELMLEKHRLTDNRPRPKPTPVPPEPWSGNIYRYGFFDGDQAYNDVLAGADGDPMPRLDAKEGWRKWKTLMLSMKGKGSDVVAHYLFCATQASS